jgi:hypothetical protein
MATFDSYNKPRKLLCYCCGGIQTWILQSFRLPFIIDFDALHYLYYQAVVMDGYGLVLNFATDATAYEFARTIYSISTCSTSNFEL